MTWSIDVAGLMPLRANVSCTGVTPLTFRARLLLGNDPVLEAADAPSRDRAEAALRELVATKVRALLAV